MSGKSPKSAGARTTTSGGAADPRWAAVDAYLDDALAPDDPALIASIADSRQAGLPDIAVTPTQGKLLFLLARAVRARRILEIGTLGGYSAIWMARALEPGGQLVTLEFVQKHADVARTNIARAGLAQVVDIRVGAALRTLATLEAGRAGPFDLTFIDADKRNNAAYFDWAVKLSRPGSLIVVDNVIRHGSVIDAKTADPDALGVRALFDLVRRDKRVTVTAVQTVGAKGYDGFLIALVT